MTKQSGDFKIDAVLKKIHHQKTAEGYGFNELIFSITNVGDEIISSDVSMATMLPGQTDKNPLPFPEGISILKKGHSIAFNSIQGGICLGAIIVLTRMADGMEIARTRVRDA